MTILSRFILPAALFVLTLGFGFWVSRLGKPYNGILFNVHKLLALAAVVLTVIQVVRLYREPEAQALPLLLVVLAALCVIALFTSGALMSAEKWGYTALRLVHHGALILAVAAGAAVVLLNLKR
jgi:hypothetical protein